MSACLKKLGGRIDLSSILLGKDKFLKVVDCLSGFIKRSEIDLVFRKYVKY